jgi:stage 0 sporulation protein B (sporulation initiation phosphotransferase)
MSMSNKWTTVDLLRHARHDWLNQLQLIKANLSLDRTERAKEIMNEVIELSREESRISNLKTPNLSEYLLTYNWLKHPVKLNGKVNGEGGDFSLFEDELLHTTIELCNMLNNSISGYDEHSLTVTFDPEALRVFYTFQGTLTDQEKSFGEMKKIFSTHKSMYLIESYTQDNKCYVEIQLTS